MWGAKFQTNLIIIAATATLHNIAGQFETFVPHPTIIGREEVPVENIVQQP